MPIVLMLLAGVVLSVAGLAVLAAQRRRSGTPYRHGGNYHRTGHHFVDSSSDYDHTRNSFLGGALSGATTHGDADHGGLFDGWGGEGGGGGGGWDSGDSGGDSGSD